MTKEEEKLIIPYMMNYLKKYRPDEMLGKLIVRAKQSRETDIYWRSRKPVTRAESLLMLLSIVAHDNLTVFKVDLGSAFMRTPMMVDDVKQIRV